MSTDEIQIQIIDRYLQKIAVALGLPTAPDRLDRAQVAQIAGLGSARSLASSIHRGVEKLQPRWLVFRAVIGAGAHSVPSARVARWLAADDGLLDVSASPGQADPAVAGPAPTPASVWAGLTHRCLGGG
jgi:hypothetical protein